MQNYLFLSLLAAGFIYRLYLGSNAYSDLIWDMGAYSAMAKEILQKGLTADCCMHGAGYPLVLAVIYHIFGIENITAVRIIQAIIDVATSFLVFLIGRDVFGKKVAWYSFVLYLFNPFTSAYTGLILTETLAIFYFAFLGYIIIRLKTIQRMIIWLFPGLLLGIISYTKMSFFYFVLASIVLFPIIYGKKFKTKIFLTLILLGGFGLAVIYPIISNFSKYKIISVMPPYRTMGTYLYGSFFIGRFPEIITEYGNLDPNYARLSREYFYEYASAPDANTQYPDKYRSLFWQKLKMEWPLIIKNTLRNSIWIWDKPYLFIYNDPFYPTDTWILRIITASLFFFFGLGLIDYISRERKKSAKNPLVVFTILLFLYISIILGMVTNETRMAMPFYPFLILWGGYGAFRIHTFIRHRFNGL